MDAVKFIEERRRMYEATGYLAPVLTTNVSAEEVVKEVEAWSAAHPRKTRHSVFLEQYSDAKIGENGILLMCPAEISALHRNETGGCGHPKKPCATCRREFWMQEVE